MRTSCLGLAACSDPRASSPRRRFRELDTARLVVHLETTFEAGIRGSAGRIFAESRSRAQSPEETERNLRRGDRGTGGGGQRAAARPGRPCLRKRQSFLRWPRHRRARRKIAIEGIHGSRRWHAVFDTIQRGAIPSSPRCTAPSLAGGWSLQRPHISASPTAPPSSRSRRDSAASSSAVPARFGSLV